MKKIYRKMMVLMNRKQKLKMIQILFMMVIGAILETASIGLVVPAIQVIMDPSCVEGDGALAQIYRWTGFENPNHGADPRIDHCRLRIKKRIFIFSERGAASVCIHESV